MSLELYTLAFKASFLVFIIPNLIIFWKSFRTKKKGKAVVSGLKQNAAGSIIQTAVTTVYLSLESGQRGILPDSSIKLFFLFGGLIGSLFLLNGYRQIYVKRK